MHSGENAPRVLPTAKMPDVIYEMSRKGLGLAAVTEPNGKLLGIITDGDLRRVMQKRQENVLALSAADCMTKNPITLARTELAASALRIMEERKITSLLIVDAAGNLEGAGRDRPREPFRRGGEWQRVAGQSQSHPVTL